jgi:hypothetical protein
VFLPKRYRAHEGFLQIGARGLSQVVVVVVVGSTRGLGVKDPAMAIGTMRVRAHDLMTVTERDLTDLPILIVLLCPASVTRLMRMRRQRIA